MTPGNWRLNILLAIGVILTVLSALILSQLDFLRLQLQPTPVPVANLPLGEVTNTPLPAIPRSTNSPTPTITATPEGESLPTATAVSEIFRSCGDVPPGWVPYLVQHGDTLFYLALSSGESIAKLSQVNCLEMGTLISGMTIYLPITPPRRVECGPPLTWVQYMVQPGDTMYSLATSRGTTVYAVLTANCLSSSYLQAGRQIYLPPLAVPPTALPTATNPPPTPIPTATATQTPVSSVTPTTTPTIFPTPTGTNTPIGTVTATVTATATGTVIGTPTATPTATGTATGTPISGTATPTNTPLATNTPTAVPTNSPTPTPTLTSTPVPTATETVAPTPTATGTAVSPLP